MISGTAYGVALNDREQLAGLGEALNAPPYGKPPVAPILYVKPRNCFAAAGAAVTLPADVAEVAVGATIAIERSAAGPQLARLAIDLFAPHASFYRPAIAERCRDGFPRCRRTSTRSRSSPRSTAANATAGASRG